jgi:hypothetical protein
VDLCSTAVLNIGGKFVKEITLLTEKNIELVKRVEAAENSTSMLLEKLVSYTCPPSSSSISLLIQIRKKQNKVLVVMAQMH